MLQVECGEVLWILPKSNLEGMVGYLWHYMYYDVKQKLKPLGYTLFSVPYGWGLLKK